MRHTKANRKYHGSYKLFKADKTVKNFLVITGKILFGVICFTISAPFLPLIFAGMILFHIFKKK